MEDIVNIYWLAYPLWGILVGLLAGLLGVGGGVITVPFLVLIHNLQGFPLENNLKVVIASSIATIIFTSFSSALTHHQNGNVRWDIFYIVAPGLIIGSICGGLLVSIIPEIIVAGIFIFFIFYTSIQMLLNIKVAPSRKLPPPPLLGLFGWGTGTFSAMIAAGGGIIIVPFLTWCNVNIKKAIATSAACGFPIALFGTIAYIVTGWNVEQIPKHTLGFVHIPSTLGIIITSFYFAKLGAKLSAKLPLLLLRRIFGINILLIGIFMINRYFF